VVLLVVGWVWPFSASTSSWIDYGDQRRVGLRGMTDSQNIRIRATWWAVRINLHSSRIVGGARREYQPEDRERNGSSLVLMDKALYEAFSKLPRPNHAQTPFNWRYGNLGMAHEYSSAPYGIMSRDFQIEFPPWLLLPLGTLLLWTPLRTARSLRQRRRRGLCLSCGYDLKGIAVCPECGRARDSAGA
jgi:hypothetical protein